jgi:hypothetical protein
VCVSPPQSKSVGGDLAESTDDYRLMFIEQLQRYGHGEDQPFLHVAAPLQEAHRTFLRTAGHLPQHLPTKLRAEPLGRASGADLKPAGGAVPAARCGAPPAVVS